jgi:hypothetical protein
MERCQKCHEQLFKGRFDPAHEHLVFNGSARTLQGEQVTFYTCSVCENSLEHTNLGPRFWKVARPISG